MRVFATLTPMLIRSILVIALFPWAPTTVWTAESDSELAKQFDETVAPFVQKYCLSCHSKEDPEAKLDLARFDSRKTVSADHRTWAIVLERLEAADMPPADAAPQPTASERSAVATWIHRQRKFDAERNAGDPGVVLTRRLSNAEYNFSIRDLTGVDIRPTQSFPIDPANEAGFDNSGESLAMSPALLQKYLEAANQVASHLVLTPEGMHFASHPVLTDTDRDKHCVKRIVQFYERQPTDLFDYFHACAVVAQRLAKQSDTSDRMRTVEQLLRIAQQNGAKISVRYAVLIWKHLHEPKAAGPQAKLQAMFRDIDLNSDSGKIDSGDIQRQCKAMSAYVKQLRAQLAPEFENLTAPEIHKGSQPFVLWKNRQYAKNRQSFDRSVIRNPKTPANDTDAQTNTDRPNPGSGDPPSELTLPSAADQHQAYWKSLTEFCRVFPDAYYISERGRDYLDKPRDQQEKGRLLSAGFHSMMGYFRDDEPLMRLILEPEQRDELNTLWKELNFVASAVSRQYVGFLWFERTDSRYMRDPEFDFARAEDKSAGTSAMIRRLAKVYRGKAEKNGAGPTALDAIDHYFHDIDSTLRLVEEQRRLAESKHLDELIQFARQAWRRSLDEAEQRSIRETYDALRSETSSNDDRPNHERHEEAVRDTLTSILMSPYFLMRIDLGSAGSGVRALTGQEYASRLSYFLWSSQPDERLLEAFQSGVNAAAAEEQAMRMLADRRVQGLATEFAANWLGIRQFEQHNSVDRNRFPSFDDDLRSAMYQEPLRLFVDMARHDRSILALLDADYTFVNPVLAKHYGVQELASRAAEDDPLANPQAFLDSTPGTEPWIRVDGVQRKARGGLLPMAVFLTQNSPGLRTSPVKRGYWVVRRLLGEHIPPPPPNVPELPADESKLGDRSLREVLALHRAHPSCAGCHDRFDAIGIAFESYGPVGERREKDLAGRPIETSAEFPIPRAQTVPASPATSKNASQSGVDALRHYLLDKRQDEFVDNLCRRLLAYALERSLVLSDEPLLARMKQRLKGEEHHFRALIATIVTSPQFMNKRGANNILANEE